MNIKKKSSARERCGDYVKNKSKLRVHIMFAFDMYDANGITSDRRYGIAHRIFIKDLKELMPLSQDLAEKTYYSLLQDKKFMKWWGGDEYNCDNKTDRR